MRCLSSRLNFFTFEKGVGSAAVDPSKLSVDAKRALELYEQQAREVAQQAEGVESERGFPNGIAESNAEPAGAENTDFSQ